jgi:xylulokinase
MKKGKEGPYICAIDVGTTGLKAGIVDLHGEILSDAYVEYGVRYKPPHIAEQDPDQLWQAQCTALKRVLQKCNAKSIEAVCMTNQRVTWAPVDSDFQALTPYFVWSDRRGEEQCSTVREVIGEREYYNCTGLLLDPTPAISKILWFKQNQRALYKKTARLWQIPNIHMHRMGIEDPPLDPSNAAWFGFLDINSLQWNENLLKAFDMRKDIFPDVVPSGTIIGHVSKDAAVQTGLIEGTPIILGGGDQQVGSIGCGVVEPGVASISLGTGSAVMVFSDRPILSQSREYYTQPHALPDAWEIEMFTITSGAALRWFRDTIGVSEMEEARRNNRDYYDLVCEKASKVPPGSNGLLFIPTMSGIVGDAYTRGSWFGLTLAHGREDLVRSIFEGVVFELKGILSNIVKGGLKIKEVRLTGGGAKSDFWAQMQADIFGIRVAIPHVTDAPLLGCLFIAGLGIGAYDSLQSFSKDVVRINKIHKPDENLTGQYEQYFNIYKELYDRVVQQDFFKRISIRSTISF